jgi:hypothetical protein
VLAADGTALMPVVISPQKEFGTGGLLEPVVIDFEQ